MNAVPDLALPIARPARRPWSRALLRSGTLVALILAFLWWIGVLGGNVRE